MKSALQNISNFLSLIERSKWTGIKQRSIVVFFLIFVVVEFIIDQWSICLYTGAKRWDREKKEGEKIARSNLQLEPDNIQIQSTTSISHSVSCYLLLLRIVVSLSLFFLFFSFRSPDSVRSMPPKSACCFSISNFESTLLSFSPYFFFSCSALLSKLCLNRRPPGDGAVNLKKLEVWLKF